MEHPVDENNYPLFDGLDGLKQKPMKTAMQELESLFYNEAQPTINTNIWVIHKEAFEKLILAAKEQEKKQIIEAHAFGADNVDSNGGLLLRGVKNAIYNYNKTYNQNK